MSRFCKTSRTFRKLWSAFHIENLHRTERKHKKSHYQKPTYLPLNDYWVPSSRETWRGTRIYDAYKWLTCSTAQIKTWLHLQLTIYELNWAPKWSIADIYQLELPNFQHELKNCTGSCVGGARWGLFSTLQHFPYRQHKIIARCLNELWFQSRIRGPVREDVVSHTPQ